MRAIEHLKTLCCLGLPPESAIIALTPLLHEIIPHRWTRFDVFALGKTHGCSERPETTSLCREGHIRPLEEPGPAQVWIAQRQAAGIGWVLHPQGRGWLDTSPSYYKIEAPLDFALGPERDDRRRQAHLRRSGAHTPTRRPSLQSR